MYVGNYGYYNLHNSWITKRNLGSDAWTAKYLQAYYFVTVTMITVGYGDITPQNPVEMLICIFTMLFSCGVFAQYILIN